MTELIQASQRLSADLSEAGVPPVPARDARHAYERALARGRHADWARFYLAVYAALETIAAPLPSGAAALRRLTALFDDDLGASLIAADRRRRLRARLVEAA
jgi:hypothetical protein